MSTTVVNSQSSIVDALLSGDVFWPSEPETFQDTGLVGPFVDSLLCKQLLADGTASGRTLSEELCLPFSIVQKILANLRTRLWVTHVGSSMLNDYRYALTDEGTRQAQVFEKACGYAGPAPVPLADYIISVEAQAIGFEAISREKLENAFQDISVTGGLLDLVGPAVNSGAGMFLYGAPGNGKSTLARRITDCFGQHVWIPNAVIDGGDILRVFDPAYHREVAPSDEEQGRNLSYDRRWRRIRRPTVIVGGELTMENLDIHHDANSHVNVAPLQLKSNCGCLLIDDFGRQRISPAEMLNRWIIPLENRVDFLTFPNGKKIKVPFQQLIIFSTNLDPDRLVDEAFLRRIPYKIELADPAEDEFHHLFQIASIALGCDYRGDAVDHLLEKWYRPFQRRLRRCHPRDILQQIRNLCAYEGRYLEMDPELIDRVAVSCFTNVLNRQIAPGGARDAASASEQCETAL